MSVIPAASVIVAGVTSWPNQGVALLILLVILLAIVTIAVNRAGTARTPVIPPEEREAIAPPSSDLTAGMREPRDI